MRGKDLELSLFLSVSFSFISFDLLFPVSHWPSFRLSFLVNKDIISFFLQVMLKSINVQRLKQQQQRRHCYVWPSCQIVFCSALCRSLKLWVLYWHEMLRVAAKTNTETVHKARKAIGKVLYPFPPSSPLSPKGLHNVSVLVRNGVVWAQPWIQYEGAFSDLHNPQ